MAGIGTVIPSEMTSYIDKKSGLEITKLTNSGTNVHLYFTDNSFTLGDNEIIYMRKEEGLSGNGITELYAMDLTTGESVQIVSRTAESVQQRAYRYTIGSTQLLFYYGLPSPYSLAQEFYVEFLPEGMYVDSGIWILRITTGDVVNGTMDFYLPGGGTLNEDTRFLTPSPERTLTIPAAAENVIAVGAYDARLNAYANFSGRGYTRSTNQVKPDLAAPGVGITTTKSGGGYEAVTGTSFATPFVTGAAALMMEWDYKRKL